jgi:hypothetical protein
MPDPSRVAVTGDEPGTRIRPLSPDRMGSLPGHHALGFLPLEPGAFPCPPLTTGCGPGLHSWTAPLRRDSPLAPGAPPCPPARSPLAQPLPHGRDRTRESGAGPAGEPFPPSHVASTTHPAIMADATYRLLTWTSVQGGPVCLPGALAGARSCHRAASCAGVSLSRPSSCAEPGWA